MKLKKIYNVKQFLEDLEEQGFEIFYTKGEDTDSVKVYEDNKETIYINYNYSSSKKVFLYVIEVFYRAVSWKIIIVFFIIFLLASLVPIIELQRRSLVSIIGGRKIWLN